MSSIGSNVPPSVPSQAQVESTNTPATHQAPSATEPASAPPSQDAPVSDSYGAAEVAPTEQVPSKETGLLQDTQSAGVENTEAVKDAAADILARMKERSGEASAPSGGLGTVSGAATADEAPSSAPAEAADAGPTGVYYDGDVDLPNTPEPDHAAPPKGDLNYWDDQIGQAAGAEPPEPESLSSTEQIDAAIEQLDEAIVNLEELIRELEAEKQNELDFQKQCKAYLAALKEEQIKVRKALGENKRDLAIASAFLPLSAPVVAGFAAAVDACEKKLEVLEKKIKEWEGKLKSSQEKVAGLEARIKDTKAKIQTKKKQRTKLEERKQKVRKEEQEKAKKKEYEQAIAQQQAQQAAQQEQQQGAVGQESPSAAK